MGEACAAPGIVLAERLATAKDAPKLRGSDVVDTNAIPHFFKTWAPSAYKDLLDTLHEESVSEEVVASAEEQFRRRVAATLLTHVTIGHKHERNGHEVTDTERRPLIGWCRLFAKLEAVGRRSRLSGLVSPRAERKASRSPSAWNSSRNCPVVHP